MFLVRTFNSTVFPKDLRPCSGVVTEVVRRWTSLIRYFTSQPISIMPLSAVMSCKRKHVKHSLTLCMDTIYVWDQYIFIIKLCVMEIYNVMTHEAFIFVLETIISMF